MLTPKTKKPSKSKRNKPSGKTKAVENKLFSPSEIAKMDTQLKSNAEIEQANPNYSTQQLREADPNSSATDPTPEPTPQNDSCGFDVGDDGFINHPHILKYNVEGNANKDRLQGPNALVLHRTNTSNGCNTLDGFSRGLGTHFLVDVDGSIYQAASLFHTTNHVGRIRSKCDDEGTCEKPNIKNFNQWNGTKATHAHEKQKSYPERYPINEDSIGIEVVGSYNDNAKCWEELTAQQIASVVLLVNQLKDTYCLTNADIFTHEKISRKTAGEGGVVLEAIQDQIQDE